ncbi:MAG: GTPase ObgE [Clostridiales Family XIII bacterium]|jgi:GTP-binding protein|nr:GTPase ObgE [Clostridiales Family XIII bacterium]
MFVDRAQIVIQSGRGGDGAVSFRREPFVPNGGPDGGNGGKGGDVVFVADRNLHTLMDLRFMKKYKAQAGQNGMGANKYGKGGEDLTIKVPVGSVLIDEASGAFMADLSADGDRFIAALGGKGGLGNANFKNSVRQAPNFAEAGSAGQERTVVIELKLIADVGLVGLPNVGKSTLLAATTGAKPKIANYHFTTTVPNLGVVDLGYRTFVLADIPGLIEGAAQGVGLGHDFLKHVERTKVLIHVVDASGSEGRDPREDYVAIEREMAAYSPLLAEKPVLCALNKIDLLDSRVKPENDNRLSENDGDGEGNNGVGGLEAYLAERGVPVFRISAATRTGVDALLNAAAKLLADAEEAEAAGGGSAGGAGHGDQRNWMRVTRIEDDPDYRDVLIEQDEDGAFVLKGKQLYKIFDSTNFNDPGSLGYLNKYLADSGAIRKLKARGLEDGGTIRIKNFDLEWYDDED